MLRRNPGRNQRFGIGVALCILAVSARVWADDKYLNATGDPIDWATADWVDGMALPTSSPGAGDTAILGQFGGAGVELDGTDVTVAGVSVLNGSWLTIAKSSAASLAVSGQSGVDAGAAFSIQDGGRLANGGTFTNSGIFESYGRVENGGTFTNLGNFTSYGDFRLSGTLSNQSLSFENDGTIHNDGRIVNGGSLYNGVGGVIDGAGEVQNDGDLLNDGRLEITRYSGSGGVFNNGTLTLGSGTINLPFSNYGRTEILGQVHTGNNTNEGVIAIDSNAELTAVFFVNEGAVSNSGSLLLPSLTINAGIIENLAGARMVVSGQFFNNGAVFANEGLLQLDGWLQGGVDLKEGSILSGSGSIDGIVQVEGDALLSPTGTSILSAGGLQLDPGARLEFHVSDATGTAGTAAGWSRVDLAAGLALGATGASPVILSIQSYFDAATPGPAAHFDPYGHYVWSVIHTSTGITGFDPSLFRIDASGFDLAQPNAFSVELSEDGDDLLVVYAGVAPVPEPATIVAAVFAAAVGIVWSRRRSA